MAKSMTGYGMSELTMHERKITVEIKSVNHKYNDINIKMPRLINQFEDAIKSIINKKVFRGKVDVYITLDSFSKNDVSITYNENLTDNIFNVLNEIKEKYSLSDKEHLLPLIANFNDVILINKDEHNDEYNDEYNKEILETLIEVVEKALNNFILMRETEGAYLSNDILIKNSQLEIYLNEIKEYAPKVAAEYALKLKNKVSEALLSIPYDESRLIQEITIFSDKSCIDEEIIRLSSHISQINDVLKENDTIGKKLDFVIQEMNREVNTIGSKANNLVITKIIIEMKSCIEKIREQAQNLE